MKKKPYSINYLTIEDLMKGYYAGFIESSNKINTNPSDTIINTANSGYFAHGMLDSVTDITLSREDVIKVFGDNPEGSKRGFVVDWHYMPAKISAYYTCV